MHLRFKTTRLDALTLALIISALAAGCEEGEPSPAPDAEVERPQPYPPDVGDGLARDASTGLDGDAPGPGPICGDGVVDEGELCDGDCPSICDDGLACTRDRLEGSAERCDARCAFEPIDACEAGDGCCPAGCDANNDRDCEPGCGNGIIEGSETCDGECPTEASCDDGDACTRARLDGAGRTCNARCVSIPIQACASGDGCCPAGCDANTDDDCEPECGNGVIEATEQCDGRCPSSCDDGIACTEDLLIGDPSSCDAICEHAPVEACRHGDGCCPAGCDARADDDCGASCGDGVVEGDETCDGQCPTPGSCDDGDACTSDRLEGSAAGCDARCASSPIVNCNSGDGCCPVGCDANSDSDCEPECGNGVVEAGEACDGDCPSACDDGLACTEDLLVGDPARCDAACAYEPVAACQSGDGCCPAGCDAHSDGDCSQTCGNGALEAGELCDGDCPTPGDCESDDVCVVGSLLGSAEACSAQCVERQIEACLDGDGCCPPGCSAHTDSDCLPTCGNGVVEGDELCDGRCPTLEACDDGFACTADAVSGDPEACAAACAHEEIVACRGGDGCCPPGCDANTDDDCLPTCGNGVVEEGEACDGDCPTRAQCAGGNACVTDLFIGSPESCSARCLQAPVEACQGADGCCPSSCNANTDEDCAPSCGNGVQEPGEGCDDGNSADLDGCSSACEVEARVPPEWRCDPDFYAGQDGCDCGCGAHDPDCADETAASCSFCSFEGSCDTTRRGCPGIIDPEDNSACLEAYCGNGVVDEGEICDGDCPATCPDLDSCTLGILSGSPEGCDAVCSHLQISACHDADGCCPPGCDANNDDDCAPTCGNGVVESPETCDGACPSPAACDDGLACTADALSGGAATCDAACVNEPIARCVSGDGCCPEGCNAVNDADCSASCGNGIVEGGEACDGDCPSPNDCDDGVACTADSFMGSAINCTARCINAPIASCRGGDGCCPDGCDANNDSDCDPVCGNGVIEPPSETCDGNCPMHCDDQMVCTRDEMLGAPGECNVRCINHEILSCEGGDGCCPAGCNANQDHDCDPVCGNGDIEPGETCDGVDCPEIADCNDGNACTVDQYSGSPASCTALCSHHEIFTCIDDDGCCPQGCSGYQDSDCEWSQAPDANRTGYGDLIIDHHDSAWVLSGDIFNFVEGLWHSEFERADFGGGYAISIDEGYKILNIRNGNSWDNVRPKVLIKTLFGEGWITEEYESSLSMEFNRIAYSIDANGNIAVLFRRSGEPGDSIGYIMKINGEWLEGTIPVPSSANIYSFDITISEARNVYFSYVNESKINIASYTEGAWSLENTQVYTDSERNTKISALNNVLYVSHVSIGGKIGFIHGSRNAWISNISPYSTQSIIFGLDLEVDQEGNVHIVANNQTLDAVFCFKYDNEWHKRKITDEDNIDYGFYIDLELESDGHPHILIFRGIDQPADYFF